MASGPRELLHVQNHYDYLNFYIPIVKPDIEKSNLCLIPFDVLERESPKAYEFLVRGGATHFHPLGERCLAVSDETGDVRSAPERHGALLPYAQARRR